MQEEIMDTPVMEDAKIVEEVETAPEVKAFEYGDLQMTCTCGAEFELGKGVKNGISLVLVTNSASEWVVSCNKCNTTMKIFFKESSEETIAIQRQKEQELKDKENEQVQQGNTEEDIHTGVSGDSELSTESNA